METAGQLGKVDQGEGYFESSSHNGNVSTQFYYPWAVVSSSYYLLSSTDTAVRPYKLLTMSIGIPRIEQPRTPAIHPPPQPRTLVLPPPARSTRRVLLGRVAYLIMTHTHPLGRQLCRPQPPHLLPHPQVSIYDHALIWYLSGHRHPVQIFAFLQG